MLIAVVTRYIVAFRSKRRPDANTEWLYAADREAHEEAVTAGGLLLYWSVSPACVGCSFRIDEGVSVCHVKQVRRSRRERPELGDLHLAVTAACIVGQSKSKARRGSEVGIGKQN